MYIELLSIACWFLVLPSDHRSHGQSHNCGYSSHHAGALQVRTLPQELSISMEPSAPIWIEGYDVKQ